MEKENIEYLGMVFNYKEAIDIGSIVLFGSISSSTKLNWKNIHDLSGFFQINDCKIPIHHGKIVKVVIANQEKEIPQDLDDWNKLSHWSEKGKLWFENIDEFSPNRNNYFIDRNVFQISSYGSSILMNIFGYNPSLFEFVIAESLHNDHFYTSINERLSEWIKEIHRLDKYLLNFQNFDLEKIIKSYKIKVTKVLSGSRPGKDEWAGIFRRSECSYWPEDPYITQYLKTTLNETLDINRGFTLSKNLDNFDEATIERHQSNADLLRESFIKELRTNYSKIKHYKTLKQLRDYKIRFLKGKVLERLSKTKFYF